MSSSRPWFARAFDRAYLEVYAHRDAAEAEAATQHLLVPLGLAGKDVLDLACGGGRYIEATARRGARVTGLDLSPALLDVARGAAPRACGLVRGHMLQLPFAPACFDLVLCMFTSFGYMSSADDDLAVLREVRRVLRTPGALVLDLFNAERVRQSLPGRSERRVGRFLVREARRLDAEEVVVKEIELRDGAAVRRYEERVRLWPYAALRDALAGVGLPLRGAWGSYRGDTFDAGTSERLVVLASAHAGAC